MSDETQAILDAAVAGDVKAFFVSLYRRNFLACDNYEEEVTLAEALEALDGAAEQSEGHRDIRRHLKQLNKWMAGHWGAPALCYWQGVEERLSDAEYDAAVEECFHHYRKFFHQ